MNRVLTKYGSISAFFPNMVSIAANIYLTLKAAQEQSRPSPVQPENTLDWCNPIPKISWTASI
jgi:hypothetical protein